MSAPSILSQRLLRKGALVEETYGLFAGWHFDGSIEDNFAQGLRGRFRSLGWESEVASTIGRRLRNFDRIKPLIVLAKAGMSLADWRDCWRLWVGATEQPFSDFATSWLFGEYSAGRYRLRSDDVREVAAATWKRYSPSKALSEYGVVRAARDLVKTAVDLGMLSGNGPAKTFAPLTMSDEVTLFYVHQIADFEGGYPKVPGSALWRLAFMAPDDVHRNLLRLHQFRKLDYQVAGTFVQLSLPASSPLAFAESLAA